MPLACETGMGQGDWPQGTQVPAHTNSGSWTPEVPRCCSDHYAGPWKKASGSDPSKGPDRGQSTQEQPGGCPPPSSESHQTTRLSLTSSSYSSYQSVVSP